MDGRHEVPSETQEERDLDLKAHVSVTSACGDTFSDNRSGSVIIKDCGLDRAIVRSTEGYK